jgi:hypothetical protein
MRKIFFFLFITGAVNSFAQTHSLVNVLLVEPKIGTGDLISKLPGRLTSKSFTRMILPTGVEYLK